MTPEHQNFLELLPWYVNGSLPEDESAELRAHLKSCLSCNAALREEQRVLEFARQSDRLGLERRHGMAALLERIDAAAAPRLRFAPRIALGYGLAAAVSGLLVWSVVGLDGPGGSGAADGSFSTLSDGAPAAAGRIDVIFVEPPEWPELEGFLAEFGGTLISGPTELGRYTIELASASADGMQQTLETLRDDPRIRFAGRTFIDAGEEDAGEGAAR